MEFPITRFAGSDEIVGKVHIGVDVADQLLKDVTINLAIGWTDDGKGNKQIICFYPIRMEDLKAFYEKNK